MLVGGPAELDREQVIRLGADEGAVALSSVLQANSFPEVILQVTTDAFGLAVESILEEMPSQRSGELLRVSAPRITTWMGRVRARILQLWTKSRPTDQLKHSRAPKLPTICHVLKWLKQSLQEGQPHLVPFASGRRRANVPRLGGKDF
jgi:hypothetical protein